jgi:hypothetical protein
MVATTLWSSFLARLLQSLPHDGLACLKALEIGSALPSAAIGVLGDCSLWATGFFLMTRQANKRYSFFPPG